MLWCHRQKGIQKVVRDMRRLLISFQVILLFVYSAGAQMKTAREKTDLVGRVRTVRTEIAEIIKDGNRYTEGPYVRTPLFTMPGCV